MVRLCASQAFDAFGQNEREDPNRTRGKSGDFVRAVFVREVASVPGQVDAQALLHRSPPLTAVKLSRRNGRRSS
jgi:hypothetical protein